MNTETRNHIPAGYVTFTGATLTQSQVDTYNAVQDRINSFIAAGREVPEYILNGSHNLFAGYCYNGASKEWKGE